MKIKLCALFLIVLVISMSGCTETSTSYGLGYDDVFIGRMDSSGTIVPSEDNVFNIGEDVYLVFTNVGTFKRGEDGKNWIEIDIEVKDSSGNIVFSEQDMLGEEGHVSLENDVASAPYGVISTDELGSGKHIMKETIRDKIGSGKITSSIEFTLKSEGVSIMDTNIEQDSNREQSDNEAILGNWVIDKEYGTGNLVFTENKLTMGGQVFDYTLEPGNILRITGDSGSDDYTYTLSGDKLSMSYSDGWNIQCTRGDGTATMSTAPATNSGGNEYLLQGTLCHAGGSSDSYSSYSSSKWVNFDGQGSFTYGSESSFSSDAGGFYDSGADGSGTYSVVGDNIYLSFSDGTSLTATVYFRQDDGRITEIYVGSDLYATGLC